MANKSTFLQDVSKYLDTCTFLSEDQLGRLKELVADIQFDPGMEVLSLQGHLDLEVAFAWNLASIQNATKEADRELSEYRSRLRNSTRAARVREKVTESVLEDLVNVDQKYNELLSVYNKRKTLTDILEKLSWTISRRETILTQLVKRSSRTEY